MESIDGFTEFMLNKAGKAKGEKQALLLSSIKTIRPFFDEYVTHLLSYD